MLDFMVLQCTDKSQAAWQACGVGCKLPDDDALRGLTQDSENREGLQQGYCAPNNETQDGCQACSHVGALGLAVHQHIHADALLLADGVLHVLVHLQEGTP